MIRDRGAVWLKTYWPHTFGSIIAGVVGVPAAVASYRHGIAVVDRSGDEAMASWLPMTTDGLLLAALVALWVRRMTGRQTGVGPWAAFGVGLVMTVATNLAGARQHIPSGPIGVAHVEVVGVALWPPLCLAIVLELVALIVVPDRGQTRPVAVASLDETPVNQGERTDEELLPALRKIVEDEGSMPGREAVRKALGVGSKRADRLRALVQVPVRLVPAQSDSDDREASG